MRNQLGLGFFCFCVGLCFTIGSAPTVLSNLSGDRDCNASTVYDLELERIRECNPGIACSDPHENMCKRRSEAYFNEEGNPVTATHCSCHELSLFDRQDGRCHIWQMYAKDAAVPKCSLGGCKDDEICLIYTPLYKILACRCEPKPGRKEGKERK